MNATRPAECMLVLAVEAPVQVHVLLMTLLAQTGPFSNPPMIAPPPPAAPTPLEPPLEVQWLLKHRTQLQEQACLRLANLRQQLDKMELAHPSPGDARGTTTVGVQVDRMQERVHAACRDLQALDNASDERFVAQWFGMERRLTELVSDVDALRRREP